jgi:RNA polymerase primary sigma factor
MRALKISHNIFRSEERELMDKYLLDIAKHPMLSAEEETALAIKIKEYDLDALDLLVKSNLRFVISVAKQFQGQGLSVDDLINEGNLGLIRAAQKFDVSKGFRFISYAVWWIRQAMMQAIVEQSKIIRTPMGKHLTYNKINKAFQLLEQEYQREPELDAVAKQADVSEEMVTEYLSSILKMVSTDTRLSDDGENSLSDILEDKDQLLPDEILMRENITQSIDTMIVQLNDRERDIINSYFGLNGEEPCTLEEIGNKYGLTRERVRQIKERGLQKMKQIAVKTNLT